MSLLVSRSVNVTDVTVMCHIQTRNNDYLQRILTYTHFPCNLAIISVKVAIKNL